MLDAIGELQHPTDKVVEANVDKPIHRLPAHATPSASREQVSGQSKAAANAEEDKLKLGKAQEELLREQLKTGKVDWDAVLKPSFDKFTAKKDEEIDNKISEESKTQAAAIKKELAEEESRQKSKSDDDVIANKSPQPPFNKGGEEKPVSTIGLPPPLSGVAMTSGEQTLSDDNGGVNAESNGDQTVEVKQKKSWVQGFVKTGAGKAIIGTLAFFGAASVAGPKPAEGGVLKDFLSITNSVARQGAEVVRIDDRAKEAMQRKINDYYTNLDKRRIARWADVEKSKIGKGLDAFGKPENRSGMEWKNWEAEQRSVIAGDLEDADREIDFILELENIDLDNRKEQSLRRLRGEGEEYIVGENYIINQARRAIERQAELEKLEAEKTAKIRNKKTDNYVAIRRETPVDTTNIDSEYWMREQNMRIDWDLQDENSFINLRLQVQNIGIDRLTNTSGLRAGDAARVNYERDEMRAAINAQADEERLDAEMKAKVARIMRINAQRQEEFRRLEQTDFLARSSFTDYVVKYGESDPKVRDEIGKEYLGKMRTGKIDRFTEKNVRFINFRQQLGDIAIDQVRDRQRALYQSVNNYARGLFESDKKHNNRSQNRGRR